MEYMEFSNEKIFKLFLRWYDQEVESYKWIPVTVADRVNILNQNDEMIAYKAFGLLANGEPSTTYHIRKDMWGGFMEIPCLVEEEKIRGGHGDIKT